MTDKIAENEVDELSVIRQVRNRLDKLPDGSAKVRVLEYVRQGLYETLARESRLGTAAGAAVQ